MEKKKNLKIILNTQLFMELCGKSILIFVSFIIPPAFMPRGI